MKQRKTLLTRLWTYVWIITLGAAIVSCTNDDDANEPDYVQSDQDFVTQAGSSGLLEVQAGQLAVERAASEDVRNYGQQMINEHTPANNELITIANQNNLTPPAAMIEKHQQVYNELAQLTGAAFDARYKTAMETAHQEDIALFEEANRELQNAALKGFVTKYLPVLRAHREHASMLP